MCARLSVLSASATPQAREVRVRGLPVLIPYIALFGYRRPGTPKAALVTVEFEA